MLELCNVAQEDINKSNFYEDLDNLIDSYCYEENINRDRIKVIMYNTNYNKEKREKLEKVGFKEVFCYEGNEDRTYTMMLDLNN